MGHIFKYQEQIQKKLMYAQSKNVQDILNAVILQLKKRKTFF